MKQNSMFSYVKRNNNNSEGVDGYQQCSSNAIEAPEPKRTKCNSVAKVRKWDDTYLTYGSFLWNSECSRYVPEMQEQHQSIESLNFLLFTFCYNCLFVDVSNNKMFDFLTSNSCFFYIFVNEGSMTNAKVYQGSTMTKRLKSTALEPHFIISEVSHMFVTNCVQTCFQWTKFLRHVWSIGPPFWEFSLDI